MLPGVTSAYISFGFALVFTGCLPWAGVMPDSVGTMGTTSDGLLAQGSSMPIRSEHFRFYRSADRRYGVPSLTGMIERAAARVALEHAGSVLLVGDISANRGGFIGGHRSHRSGRDVDFAYYITDLRGRPVDGAPLIRFDRFGVGMRNGRPFCFDSGRNWLLVEALLTDPEAQVQWIFISNGLKALLIEWAMKNNRDVNLIQRAVRVLHQPGDALPHDDHFHIRIYCPSDSTNRYCVDKGPIWPWVTRREHTVASGFTREELVEMALEEAEF
ncbi:MAG: hypothetical protein GY847_41420 [Proteobacteria bacterium]|nr:hypothetical protein [Pseudomonadota bacterium]